MTIIYVSYFFFGLLIGRSSRFGKKKIEEMGIRKNVEIGNREKLFGETGFDVMKLAKLNEYIHQIY